MKLILLTNKNFTGDNNQLKGIKSAIFRQMKSQITYEEIEESVFLSNGLSSLDQSSIVLVSGDHGLNLSKKIKQHDAKVKIIWSGHQYFSEIDELETRYFPDVIALPSTAINEEQKQKLEVSCELVQTQGVAHVVNDETVSTDYLNFQEKLPEESKFRILIGIIIAGDAPTAAGKIKTFDPDDATEQARKIAGFIKKNIFDTSNTAVMITNGPRTGKHCPETNKAHTPDPHRSEQTDNSSLAFVKTIEKELTNCKTFFYDFQFSKLQQGPSAYKPMIKKVVSAAANSSLWFVPSESTSMVTESTYLAEKGVKVVIYHPKSENNVHLEHAKEFKKQGLGIDINSELCKSTQTPKITLAAEQIAQVVYRKFSLNQSPVSLQTKGAFFDNKGEKFTGVPDADSNNIFVVSECKF